MGAALDRSFRPTNGDDGIPKRLSVVERQMADVLEHKAQVSNHLEDLLKMVGSPADGGQPATGLYGLVDGVATRLSTFEKMKERAVGATSFAIPTLTIIGGWALWQYGPTLEKLLRH